MNVTGNAITLSVGRHADLLVQGGIVMTPSGAERIDVANSGALGKVVLASSVMTGQSPSLTTMAPRVSSKVTDLYL